MADELLNEETTEPAEKQVTSDEMRKTIEAEIAEKTRAEMAGLNRKVTDLTKAFEAAQKQNELLQKQKTDAELTQEDRIKLLEQENQKQAAVLEGERRAGKLLDAGVKRNLPERVIKSVIATDWSIDDAIANMDELATELKAVHDKSVNETLVSKSYKPGSGNEQDEKAAEGYSKEDAEGIAQFEWMS